MLIILILIKTRGKNRQCVKIFAFDLIVNNDNKTSTTKTESSWIFIF